MAGKWATSSLSKGRKTSFPSFDGYAVTPSDTVDLPNGPCDALVVTGAGGGAVTVQLDANSTAVLTIAAGSVNAIYPITCSRVMATGTTATGIQALYK